MMSAPDAMTSSGFIALTVPAVPSGMNAGVRTTPRSSVIVPVRAAPSLAEIEKAKRVIPAAPRQTRLRQQQARVAVAVEAIAALDRVGVGRLHDVEAHERADQHEQGRARQMEVGD